MSLISDRSVYFRDDELFSDYAIYFYGWWQFNADCLAEKASGAICEVWVIYICETNSVILFSDSLSVKLEGEYCPFVYGNKLITFKFSRGIEHLIIRSDPYTTNIEYAYNYHHYITRNIFGKYIISKNTSGINFIIDLETTTLQSVKFDCSLYAMLNDSLFMPKGNMLEKFNIKNNNSAIIKTPVESCQYIHSQDYIYIFGLCVENAIYNTILIYSEDLQLINRIHLELYTKVSYALRLDDILVFGGSKMYSVDLSAREPTVEISLNCDEITQYDTGSGAIIEACINSENPNRQKYLSTGLKLGDIKATEAYTSPKLIVNLQIYNSNSIIVGYSTDIEEELTDKRSLFINSVLVARIFKMSDKREFLQRKHKKILLDLLLIHKTFSLKVLPKEVLFYITDLLYIAE